MKIYDLARLAIEACGAEGVDYMLTGAFATSCYGVPRSTMDVDFVLNAESEEMMRGVVKRLDGVVDFGAQVEFDTLTWGKRHVGKTRSKPFLKVEFFELFDDAFVMEQFNRRRLMNVPVLGVSTYIPTAEEVIVQKLRWARDKYLGDALDVLIVQEVGNLDIEYVRRWSRELGFEGRLEDVLSKL